MWCGLLFAAGCKPPASEDISQGIEGGGYTLDVKFDTSAYGTVGGVLRLDSRRREDGRLNGRPLSRLVLEPSLVTVESSYQRANGTISSTRLLASERVDAKTLAGRAQFCVTSLSGTTTCRSADFRAVRVERLAGEAESNGLELVGENPLLQPAALVGSGLDMDRDMRRPARAGAHDTGFDLDLGFKAGPDAVQPAVNVRVAGNLAYVAKYGDGLVVVDVSDVTRPRPLGRSAVSDVGEIYNDVKVAPDGQHVLMASNLRGMVVIDVTNPALPVEVAFTPSGPCNGTARPAGCRNTATSNVHTLFVEGSLAYLADISLGGIRIVDVSEPVRPVELGQYVIGEPGDFVHDLMIRDRVAYLSSWGNGFLIVDCNTPAAPVLLGSYTYARSTSHSNWVQEMGGRLIAMHGDEDFTAHLRMLDVTDPAHIRLLGEWQTRPEVSIHNVMMLGTRGYMAHYQDGVRVLDLSDPAAPRPLAYFNTWSRDRDPGASFFEGVIGIDVDTTRRLIFVADSQRGLIILRERF